MTYTPKKTIGCFFAEVFCNPPETTRKFDNDYRTITVVRLTGEAVKIDYKKSRKESGLEPGMRVLVKEVNTGSTWSEVVEFDPLDPDLKTFNPVEYDFVTRELEREKERDNGNISWMLTSDPLIRIRRRMEAYSELHGERREEITQYTGDWIDLYGEIYDQVYAKFGKPEFLRDADGCPIPDEYGELTVTRPALDGFGLRDVTAKAMAAATKKFNL